MESYKKSRILLQRGEISKEIYDEIVVNRAEFTAYQVIVTAMSVDGV